MASSLEAASAEIEKLRIEIRAEMWIDPFDFLPLAERKMALVTGRRPKWRTNVPMCDIDMATKESAPRFFLEILTKELVAALHRSSPSCQKQKFTKTFLYSHPLDKMASKEQTCSDTGYRFLKERLEGLQEDTVSLNSEEDQISFYVAIKVEDSFQSRSCSLDSQRNDYQKQWVCSSPLMTSRYEHDDRRHACKAALAEETRISAAGPSGVLIPKTISNYVFSEDSSLLEDDVSLPHGSQKEAQSNVSCLIVSSPLSASDVTMKVEVTDGSTNVSEMPQLLDRGVHDSLQSLTRFNNFPSAFQNSLEISKNRDMHVVGTSGSASTENYISSLPHPSARTIVRTLSEDHGHQGQVTSNDYSITDMPNDSISPTISTKVKREACDEDFLDRGSDSSLKTVGSRNSPFNFSSHIFQASKERSTIFSHVTTSGALPSGEKRQTNGPLADSVMLTFRSMVKDEPPEEDDVPLIYETNSTNNSSICSGFGLLQTTERLCESRNCQNISCCNVSSLKFNQESMISLSEIDSSADAQMTFGGNNTRTFNQPRVSGVLDFEVVRNAEELKEGSRDSISDCTTEDFSTSYSVNSIGRIDALKGMRCIDRLLGNPSDVREILAKIEVEALPLDVLDLMPLSERIRLLTTTVAPGFEPARRLRRSKKARVHGVKGLDSDDMLKFKSETCAPRRKRKKTATDSVEVALEEDAPGLLQGLLDRGIILSEIKLYGCEEDNDVFDGLSDESSFEDLEDVMCKIFTERSNSLIKLNQLRPDKGTKAVYCLACLISLIEQVRYLQFRKCPVEWGWCRDLQSFIFVFEMHNRIVLERPEYGYATYFFELVGSYPIDWQIKRLVIAMKLTNFSRVTLIENRPLLVGADISEGEACVLEEYGWRRNSGLGSMLNYCERVMHDRVHDTSDWRLKIGKILMDGYDGGRVVHTNHMSQLPLHR